MLRAEDLGKVERIRKERADIGDRVAFKGKCELRKKELQLSLQDHLSAETFRGERFNPARIAQVAARMGKKPPYVYEWYGLLHASGYFPPPADSINSEFVAALEFGTKFCVLLKQTLSFLT
jgi:hypothetical protein